MKDEEMADKHAEEYIMREDVVTENDRVPFDNGYGFQTVSFEDEVKKGYKDGFLEGLKAGRQWHTDPNDLPPMIQDERHISDRVWINVKNWGTEDGHYDYRQNCWIIRCRIVNLPILGWIEIPTFDKE